MSSIWKHPNSPYWSACFTAFVGASVKQFKLSTATADKKLARRIADELDEIGRGARTPEQAKVFLEAIQDLKAKRAARHAFDLAFRKTTGRGMESKTVSGFVKSWLERTQGEVSSGTWVKYQQAGKLFLESLAGKADQDIAEIRKDDIARFRDEQGARVARSTANVYIKIVRIIFNAAEADGLLVRNEARHVKPLKIANDGDSRRPFTLPELKKVLAHCDHEWRSMVLFGFYTGARLGDVAKLTWQNLDLVTEEISYVSRKRGRQVVIPMAGALLHHVQTLTAGDNPKQPIHFRAYEIMSKHGKAQQLSSQFADILAAAGLIEHRQHSVEDESKRKGRDGRRKLSEISFHSLRHTAVSLLKTAGISSAVAEDLVGHDSAEINRHYTHIEATAKRAAVDKLPAIGIDKPCAKK